MPFHNLNINFIFYRGSFFLIFCPFDIIQPTNNPYFFGNPLHSIYISILLQISDIDAGDSPELPDSQRM